VRYKSLPPTLRGSSRPAHHAPGTPPPPDRLRDWIAVLPMLLLVPALIFSLTRAEARGPSIAVSGVAMPGQQISLSGSNFRPDSDLQIMWDGDVAGMPSTKSTSEGLMSVAVTVPNDATSGQHAVGVAAVSKGKGKTSSADSRVIVSVMVTVLTEPSPTPEATPSSTPSTEPDPTTKPTDPPSAEASPSEPQSTPTPSPPQATPTPTPLAADALYVAPSGSDLNSGTLARPFGTVSRGLRMVGPGQTLYLRGGTYVENIRSPSIRSGSPSARILIRNYPGERPVLEGLLWLSGANYWTVNGINVTWNPANIRTEHMVKMTNGVGWVFENSELWGARSYAGMLVAGTTVSQPANWVVRGNCIHDTAPSNGINQDHNLYVNTGLSAGEGLIERNLLFNAPNGMNIKLGGPQSAAYDGSANVLVRYNTLFNASQPILLAGGTHHITIEGNIISHSARDWLVRGFQLVGVHNVVRGDLGYGADRLIYGDPGFTPIVNGGENVFPHDPQFSGTTSCNAFRPMDAAAQSYGR
jgi:hypothetical protein